MSPNNPNAPAIIQTGGMFAVAPSSIFDNIERLSQYKEMAEVLAASSFIPDAFQKKPAECLIALEYAANLGMRPLMVMQNLHVVKGKPSWDGKFIGSVIKACGRFRDMRYVMGQDGVIPEAWVQGAYDSAGRKVQNVPNLTCYISVIDVATGDEIRGTTVSIQMAVAEGWYGGKGSKWPNLPEQMLQYRAASFFGRIHVQDILLGMQTAEELTDVNASYPDAGTGAELVPGVEATGRKPRTQRQGVAAPAVQEPAAFAEAEIVNDPVSPPVTDATPPAVVEPAPAAVAPVQPAPAAPAAKPAVAAPFVMTAAHMAALVFLAANPVVGGLSEEHKPLVKEFAQAHPEYLVLPRTIRGKAEFTQAGNEYLGGLDFPDTEDPGDMGEPTTPPESTTGPEVTPPAPASAPAAVAPVQPAPAMTAQAGGAAAQPTPQEIRDATAARQYATATPASPAEVAATPALLGPDSMGFYHEAGSEGAYQAWPPTGDPETYRRTNALAEGKPTTPTLDELF